MVGKTKNIRFEYETLRSLAFGSITDSYAQIGGDFTNPISILKIYNGTDQDLFISKNGTTDHDLIPQGANFVIDITANKTASEGSFFLRAGDGLFTKRGGSVNPTSGSIFVTAIFQG